MSLYKRHCNLIRYHQRLFSLKYYQNNSVSSARHLLCCFIFLASFADLSAAGKDIGKLTPVKRISTSETAEKNTPSDERPTVSSKDRLSEAYATHDFGDVKEGKNPVHSFSYTNKTDQNIKILTTRVPCGCADVVVKSKYLKPNETTTFSVKFKYKQHKGKVSKNFYLFTDSKVNPIIKYTMTANILPKPAPVCITPSAIDIGLINPKEIKNKTFTVQNNGNRDLIINKRNAKSRTKIKTKLPLLVPAGQKKEIEFQYTATEELAKIHDKILLMTNDPRKKIVLIVVKGEVR